MTKARRFIPILCVAALLLGAAPALAQNGYVFYGSVSSANPILAPGTTSPVSIDTAGGLRVDCIAGCSGGGGSGGTVTQGPAGAAPWLTQDSADGPVSPGSPAAKAILFGGVFNTSPPTLSSGQQGAAQLDSGGALEVNVIRGGGSGGTSSSFAAAFPGIGTAIGMSQGGNMVALTGTSGSLNVDCTTGCNAASDTSNGPVSPGTAATTSKLGALVYNSSAPTLSNAQQIALQGDIHGNLLVNLNTPLPSGASVIGQVGGVTVPVTAAPTVTATAYLAGQCVGSLMTFAGAARSGGPGSGLVQSGVITDVSGQDSAIDLVIFNANPSGSTFTDHATCTVANADLGKVAGVISVSDCHLLGATAPGICQGQQQALPFALGVGNTTLYGVNIARGTPTYTATSNIADRLQFLQD